MDAAAQRGSSDNDYPTTATEAEIGGLINALQQRFAALGGGLFVSKRMSSTGKLALPLLAYTLTVPSLTIGNRETIEAKVEFHLEDELPPAQSVTETPFAVGQEITTPVPALPYQIGLKVIVLDDPPVGIPPERRDVIPRQLHDIDHLVHLMKRAVDWDALAASIRGTTGRPPLSVGRPRRGAGSRPFEVVPARRRTLRALELRIGQAPHPAPTQTAPGTRTN